MFETDRELPSGLNIELSIAWPVLLHNVAPLQLVVAGRDAESLLVNWLNELIYLAETERWMGVEYTVMEATNTGLRMRVRGITVETAPSCVKAATFHGLHVVPVPGGLEADIVLDV